MNDALLATAPLFLLRVHPDTLPQCLLLNKYFAHILQDENFWQNRIVENFGVEYLHLENMEISGIVLLETETICDLYWSLVDIGNYDEGTRRLIFQRALEIDSVPWYKLSGITDELDSTIAYTKSGLNILEYMVEITGHWPHETMISLPQGWYDKNLLLYRLGNRSLAVVRDYATLTCDDKLMSEFISQFTQQLSILQEDSSPINVSPAMETVASIGTVLINGNPAVTSTSANLVLSSAGLVTDRTPIDKDIAHIKSESKGHFLNYVYTHYSNSQAQVKANFYEQYYPDESKGEVIRSLAQLITRNNRDALDYYLSRYLNVIKTITSPVIFVTKEINALDVIITYALEHKVWYLKHVVKNTYITGKIVDNKEMTDFIKHRLGQNSSWIVS